VGSSSIESAAMTHVSAAYVRGIYDISICQGFVAAAPFILSKIKYPIYSTQ
jgi:hypothetical protein